MWELIGMWPVDSAMTKLSSYIKNLLALLKLEGASTARVSAGTAN